VTLDRVICCYPDAEALVSKSADRARKLYGLVLPRDSRLVRLSIRLENLWFWMRRSPYRAYGHPNELIDRLVAARGLHPMFERHSFFWRVVLYGRGIERSAESAA
jgi:magnesium-protoporphyrin O-methyltransferase